MEGSGIIRQAAVRSAATRDARMLSHFVTTDNTSKEFWADSAYRSKASEARLANRMLRSQFHLKEGSWQSHAAGHGAGEGEEISHPRPG